MTTEDRVTMLRIMGVTLTVTQDEEGEHLAVRGRAELVQAAAPTIRQHRDEIIEYLRSTTGAEGGARAAA